MTVISISILGSIILLDKYAFGEFGISQPIMAGTLLGLLFGDVQAGILVGAGMQLIFLGGLPIGRDIPPDGQGAGITGIASFFMVRSTHTVDQALAIALLLALIASILGGALEIIARRFNQRLSRACIRHPENVPRYHCAGLVTAFVRNMCTITPFLLAVWLIPIPEHFPSLAPQHFLIIGTGIGAAHALYLFLKRSAILYIVIGGLCGLALLAV